MGTTRSFLPLPWRISSVSALGVEIVDAERRQLLAAHARRVEASPGSRGPAGRAGSRTSGCGQDLLGLLRGEDRPREALLRLGQVEVGGRVREDVVLAGEVAEEARARAVMSWAWRAEAQRRPVRAAVVEQPALIALEDGLRDLARAE